MKKTTLRLLSIIICISMLFGGAVCSYAEDEAVTITRVHCSVYGDTATQRGLCWYTNVETDTIVKLYDGAVDVTDTVSIETECEYWQENYMHKAYITGLTAGTEYTYKIGDGETMLTGTFTTDDKDDEVNFVVITDIQANTLEKFQMGRATLDAAYTTMPDADFYANIGDFTNNCNNEQWDYYAEAMDTINATTTIAPVVGNHDEDDYWFTNLFALDTSECEDTVNGVNYSFDYGNVHVAVLNANDWPALSDAQLKWLENDMNSTDADWKIVFLHKPPYSLGKHIKWPDSTYLQKSLTAVCDATNVDIVMSGHDHVYVRTEALNNNEVVDQSEGTTYILAGAAGSKRYEFRKFVINNYFSEEILAAAVSLKPEYNNYWDGETLDSTADNITGGLFCTVAVDGGTLNFNAYVLSDETGEINMVDTLTIEKETGENTATYSGENVVRHTVADKISTFIHVAVYTVTEWLPIFLKALPEILFTYITEGTF